jgi:hypothetical protein
MAVSGECYAVRTDIVTMFSQASTRRATRPPRAVVPARLDYDVVEDVNQARASVGMPQAYT